MSPSLVRHCAPPSYSCRIPRYSASSAGMCATCSAMLARGDFAQDVAEERYDTEGTAWARRGSRYELLLPGEATALSQAITELYFLRERWADRAQDEAWHEAETVPDAGLFYDYGRVAARWYNED